MKSLTASMCLPNTLESMLIARGNQEPLYQYLLQQEAAALNSTGVIHNHKGKGE